MKKAPRKSATIRVFNVVLTYDTTKKDSELEQFSLELLTEINNILRKRFPQELPQFQVEVGTSKKIKIGITPDDSDDEGP